MQSSNMIKKLLLAVFLFISLSLQRLLVLGDNAGAYTPSVDIAIDCGSSGDATSRLYPHRNWIGDQGNPLYSPIDPNRTSRYAHATNISPVTVPDSVPYYTARLSRSAFTYAFNVSPGPKFIRLHFLPAQYLNFSASYSLFSVRAGGYLLLNNFSASLYAGHIGSQSFVGEFSITLPNNHTTLNVTFAPAPDVPNAYTFVNGIEVLSMPDQLYFEAPLDGDGIELIGQITPFAVQTTDALELVKRVNVGGTPLSPSEDTGMYRSWEADDGYITSYYNGVLPVNLTIELNYSKVANYTAPDVVYKTARSMGMNKTINLSYNLTWSFEVDSNFYYLVRLHFCEFQIEINNPTDRVFRIFIGSELAEGRADVIQWSGSKGVPIFRDYAVAMFGSEKVTTNLSVALQALPDGYTLYSDAILNGLEIFKFSNPGGILAGPNPQSILIMTPQAKSRASHTTNKIAVMTGVASGFVLLSLLCF